MPLAGVDLAVLSACETERGPEVRGEGVQGFSRALLAAGAARAVTTLWRVSDAPTAALMTVFYRQVQAGQPVDLALAEAKRTLRASAPSRIRTTGRRSCSPARPAPCRRPSAGATSAAACCSWRRRSGS
ncbi:MAG: CHAT domain-containing protein [Vicinamibacterales bacterium]